MFKKFETLAATTPASRDRYVDALRAFSIVTVVCGHWFMAVPTYDGTTFGATNALSSRHGMWLLTWVFQVMPLFFFVGGFSNAVTLDACARRGEGYASFLQARTQRLLRPMLVMLLVWICITLTLSTIGVSGSTLHAITTGVAQPLWFLGVYLLLIAFAPVMYRLHCRYAARVVIALIAIVVLVDVVRFQAGIEGAGFVNYFVIWLCVQQFGFFYKDGSLTRFSAHAHGAIALAGLLMLIVLVTVFGYPGSMVGQPGDKFSNMNPPTLAILALTIWQIGIAMLLRKSISRLLQEKRAWTKVIGANVFSMTLYLWHMTALIVSVAVWYPLGLPQFSAGSWEWFFTRPIWFTIVAAPLAALCMVFVRFDQRRASHNTGVIAQSSRHNIRMIVGVLLISSAIFGFALTSLHGIGTIHTGRQIGAFTLTASHALLALLLGTGLVSSRRSIRVRATLTGKSDIL